MNELFWIILLVVNFASILAAYRLFGKTGLYIWVALSAVIANIQVVKNIQLFGLNATLGNIVYATSFLATDILSENYGKRDAARAVWVGFFSLAVMTVLMNLALLFEPSAEDFAHDALVTIFSLLPRIAVASLCAYLLSQAHDIWAFHFWKRIAPRKGALWIRNNASTVISQLIDTVVFTSIAFIGVFDGTTVLQIGITTYVLKVLVAVLDTPCIYLASRWYDRGKISEGR